MCEYTLVTVSAHTIWIYVQIHAVAHYLHSSFSFKAWQVNLSVIKEEGVFSQWTACCLHSLLILIAH